MKLFIESNLVNSYERKFTEIDEGTVSCEIKNINLSGQNNYITWGKNSYTLMNLSSEKEFDEKYHNLHAIVYIEFYFSKINYSSKFSFPKNVHKGNLKVNVDFFEKKWSTNGNNFKIDDDFEVFLENRKLYYIQKDIKNKKNIDIYPLGESNFILIHEGNLMGLMLTNLSDDEIKIINTANNQTIHYIL